MEKEPHQPTSEEVSKAENLMTPTQQELSALRETAAQGAEALGMSLSDIEITRYQNKNDFEGTFKGRYVMVGYRLLEKRSELTGLIDNKTLTREQAVKVADRLGSIAGDVDRYRKYLQDPAVGPRVHAEVKDMVENEKKSLETDDMVSLLKNEFGIE